MTITDRPVSAPRAILHTTSTRRRSHGTLTTSSSKSLTFSSRLKTSSFFREMWKEWPVRTVELLPSSLTESAGALDSPRSIWGPHS